MKKLILVFLILTTGFVIFLSFSRPILVFFIRKNLSKQLGPVKVSVGRLNLGWQRLTLSDVRIMQDKSLNIRTKNIVLDYGLLKREIAKITFSGSNARLDLSRQKFKGLAHPKSEKKPYVFLKIKTIEISGLNLQVKIDDMRLNAVLSAVIDMEKGLPQNYFVRIIDSQKQGGYIKNGLFAQPNNQEGSFHIEEMAFGRLKANAIKGTSLFEDRSAIVLKDVKAVVLNGNISASLDFKIQTNTYSMDMSLFNISLDKLAQDFDLKKKLDLSGGFSGNIRILAKGPDLLDMNGELLAPFPGGIFVIKDQRFLKTIAAGSNQPLQIVSDSFNNYHYSQGILKLYLQDKNLILRADLNGETGSRNFVITYHDFNAVDLLGLFNLRKQFN